MKMGEVRLNVLLNITFGNDSLNTYSCGPFNKSSPVTYELLYAVVWGGGELSLWLDRQLTDRKAMEVSHMDKSLPENLKRKSFCTLAEWRARRISAYSLRFDSTMPTPKEHRSTQKAWAT
ncbi:hypothetical protein T265_05537 [Opisthorchis viverrini]|uniref:Uncharacterized protein n=1 Tax=Opisthorchis viverrini TaxID=6198 RepID=A0A074ZJC1_OPIVI|nr:hypothetical protein T265_05537 [Opisthorchis viverrini]KER27433.1 hypothetical protein T265_05537 [Opisthorchis viverrini]